jgi:hypothetical protein
LSAFLIAEAQIAGALAAEKNSCVAVRARSHGFLLSFWLRAVMKFWRLTLKLSREQRVGTEGPE